MSQTKRAYDKFLLYALLIIALGVIGFISATTVIDPSYINTTGPILGSTGTFSGALTGTTLDTGQGANELFDMDQNVLQASAVTFSTVNTGQGANELFDMDQNVLQASAVTFATVNTGQGANDLWDMDQNVMTTSTPEFAGITIGGVPVGTAVNSTHLFGYYCWIDGATAYYQNLGTGAIGSGSEQNVIDAVLAASPSTVYLGAGTWNGVNWDASGTGTHIIGAGRDKTVLEASGAGSYVIRISGLNGVIEHLTVDGGDYAVDGIELSGGRTRALHVYVYDCNGDGIEVTSSGGCYVDDARVRQSGVVRGAGTVGIRIDTNAADVEVMNSIVSECEIGIDCSGGTNRIFTCHIWGNVYGITLCRQAAHGEYIISNNFIEDNTHEAIRATYYYTWSTTISDNCIDGNGVAADATYANILFNKTLGAVDHYDVLITDNTFDRISGGGETDRVLYHIWTVNGASFIITSNVCVRYSLTAGSTMFNLTNPTEFIVRDNHGYGNNGFITMSGGTGSITSGGTSDVITHGLDVTPEAWQIIVTLSENPTNTPGAIYVDTITSTQFTVHCENDPGASNLDFTWYVDAARIGF